MPLTRWRDPLLLVGYLAGAAALAAVLGFPLIAAGIVAVMASGAVLALWSGYRTRRRRPDEPGFKYVLVDAAGVVRELTPDEITYLSTPFAFGDGAAPHIKNSYEQRNALGSMAGYLDRTRVPAGVPIHPQQHSASA
jgi:hypothetical protein